MFEHYILGIPRIPIPSADPLSTGALSNLSNVSPGTCLPPSKSYFPLFRGDRLVEEEGRASIDRMGSLDGLQNALAAMERGTTIEKDEVDTGLCVGPGGEADMFLGSAAEIREREEEERGEKHQKPGDYMARRRNIRGRETRRLAMIQDQVGEWRGEQFVEELEKQQEKCALAFRTRVKEAANEDICDVGREEDHTLADTPTPRSAAHAPSAPFESAQPPRTRRHSVYPSPPQESYNPHTIREEKPRSHSSSASGSPSQWQRTYSSPIGRMHILEHRKSFSNGGVLNARVHKRICQRRGM